MAVVLCERRACEKQEQHFEQDNKHCSHFHLCSFLGIVGLSPTTHEFHKVV